MSLLRTRWAAVGAAVAITLGAGGIGLVSAAKDTGDRAVYTAIEPCRLLDTRPGQGIGGRTAPLGPHETYPLTAHGTNGQCIDIPTDTVALELNVTGLQATETTYFTIWDGQGAVPNASHLNLTAGHGPTPNSVTTDLNAGKFSIYNDVGSAHAIIDIVGIYQDHNHDDRYYTEAQVDELLATNGPIAWGMSREDGSLRAQTPNVVEVQHPGVGLYCVVFDPPVAGARLESATISGSGSGPIMAEKTNGIGGADSCSGSVTGGLELRVYNQSGALSDERFGFIVP